MNSAKCFSFDQKNEIIFEHFWYPFKHNWVLTIKTLFSLFIFHMITSSITHKAHSVLKIIRRPPCTHGLGITDVDYKVWWNFEKCGLVSQNPK